MADITEIVETARNLLNISSLLLTGNVKIVSNVI